TAAGMDLTLHHPDRTRQLFCSGLGVLRLQHRHALRDRYAELVQQGLGLIFVDIHRETLPKPFISGLSMILLGKPASTFPGSRSQVEVSAACPCSVAGMPYTTRTAKGRRSTWLICGGS